MTMCEMLSYFLKQYTVYNYCLLHPIVEVLPSGALLPLNRLRFHSFIFFCLPNYLHGASQMAQWWRIHLSVQQTPVQSLGGEGLQEEEIATHSSILAWKMPWTGKCGGLLELHRVGHDWATEHALLAAYRLHWYRSIKQ